MLLTLRKLVVRNLYFVLAVSSAIANMCWEVIYSWGPAALGFFSSVFLFSVRRGFKYGFGLVEFLKGSKFALSHVSYNPELYL